MQSWHVGHEVDNQSQEEELIDDTILTKNVSRILQSWHVLCATLLSKKTYFDQPLLRCDPPFVSSTLCHCVTDRCR